VRGGWGKSRLADATIERGGFFTASLPSFDIQSSGALLLSSVEKHTAIRMNSNNHSLYAMLTVTYLDRIHHGEYRYDYITWDIIDKRGNSLERF
jgi:hypothetical protein